MIKGNGGNKRVDGGQRESFRATDAENSSRFAVRGQAERLEHVPLRKMTLDWSTSRLRPCKVSETITPERAKGSASAIIRRSSVPARLGEGLKKSTPTEVSTRIKPDFSETTCSSPSRYHCHGNGEYSCDSPNGRATAKLYQRFRALFSGA